MALTPTATHYGPFLIESDGTTVAAVHPHPLDPDPSPIGQGLVDVDRCRVARPSIRRSWLEGGPGSDPHLRGNEPFVEVEWDRALGLVAAELTRVRTDHGNEAIYGASYGWGSSGRFHMPSNQVFRFLRMFGGYTDGRGTYSSSAAEAIIPYLFGSGYGRNGRVGRAVATRGGKQADNEQCGDDADLLHGLLLVLARNGQAHVPSDSHQGLSADTRRELAGGGIPCRGHLSRLYYAAASRVSPNGVS